MYARMVTIDIKPDKIDEMGAFFQNKLLKLIKRQPGFKGVFLLKRPEEHKEVSITLWENLLDLEAFHIKYATLRDEIVPLLASVPLVEIYQVVLPEEAKPADVVSFSESALGINIVNRFDDPCRDVEEIVVEM